MSDRVFITPEEAESMISDDEYIHTFRQGGPCLIGADWERSKLIESFHKYKVELSGEQATAMKHGIVFFDEHGPCFVETVANQSLDEDALDHAKKVREEIPF